MKKYLIIPILLSLGLVLISCEKFEKKLQEMKPTKVDPFAVNSGDENVDIVNFNNKLVEMTDNHRKLIDGIYKNLNKAEGFIDHRLKQPSFATAFYQERVSPIVGVKDNLEAPNVLGKPYQEKVDALISDFNRLNEYLNEFKVYMNTEEWQKDEGAKIEDWKEETSAIINHHQTMVNTLFADFKEQIDKVEERNLKNHPLKKQLLQSRNILNLSYKIVDDSYNYEDMKEYLPSLKSDAKKLEELYKANMKSKIPSSQKNKEYSFKRFNERVGDFMQQVQKVIHAIENQDPNRDRELDFLESQSETLRMYYNQLVN